MALIHSDILDAALQEIEDRTDRLLFLHSYPETYADCTTFLLASKSSPTIVGPQASADGDRGLQISTFVDGTTVASGMAECWALVDDAADVRLLVGFLERQVRLVAGQALVLEEPLVITIPVPEDAP